MKKYKKNEKPDMNELDDRINYMDETYSRAI
jgi:hypothetical protein